MDISVKGLSFIYPNATHRAVDDVTLDIPSGMSMALVGKTGSGKSTLADLIMGVLNPESGSVRLGDVSPQKMSATHPGVLGYVPQSVTVVRGSVLENVCFGLPPEQMNESRVWEVLELVEMADFLKAERDGIHTLLAEDAIKLSGGQRQRLGLARALYTEPKVLVLDEATSALDAETEFAISGAVAELKGNVTLVVIAHRLSTIRSCDLVAYMEQGHIAAMGTLDQVRDASKEFSRQLQLSGL